MGNCWHIKNWFRVGRKISWKLNFYTLNGFLYLYRPFQREFNYNQAEKKHRFVLSYLKKELNDIIEQYKNIHECKQKGNNANYIWTLWWQGVDSAPPLVKACINTMQQNANGAKLVIITKDNYKDYIKLPDYIISKREKGYISFAQLSDIIRFSLLRKYGGLWLDSTVFVSKPIPKSYFYMPFFSQHTKWQKTCFVQHNLYHGFIVGSMPNGKLASFMQDCFFRYWEKNDVLIDYLMIDYLIYIAYLEFDDIHKEIDSLDYSSERLYDLVKMLNQPFDKSYFDALRDECIFSKLDWHKKYKMKVKGQNTFYSTIIKQNY